LEDDIEEDRNVVIRFENSCSFIVDFWERRRGGSLSFFGMVTHVRIRVTSGLLPTGLLQADIGACSWSAL
jgi:hypothetical protein